MVYLAITADEMQNCRKLPAHPAWMACHFSSNTPGLADLPSSLPEGALLILNDRNRIHGHDPLMVCKTLEQTLQNLRCCGLLLDLQRPADDESRKIVKEILMLPYPVCVGPEYAADLDCPIFLPPVPLLKTPEEYLSPWKGREIWLEAALDGLVVTVTENGSHAAPIVPDETEAYLHIDEALFCHYRVQTSAQSCTFSLRRNYEDLQNLLSEAQRHGAVCAVGLWQELGPWSK